MADGPRTLLICCGAIAGEIVALVRNNGWHNVAIECLPAHVHNTPELIPQGVREKIRGARGRFEQILVLFSDCGTGGALDAVLEEEGVERIGGSHCYEVFAGSEVFAAMMAAEPGSFFLTDFLARHFDRLIIRGLGLDRYPNLRDSYFGNYRRVVYLAQSDNAELRKRAEDAARRLGLDFETRPAGAGNFERFIACRRACAPVDDAAE